MNERYCGMSPTPCAPGAGVFACHQAIRQAYRECLTIRLVMGGLRPERLNHSPLKNGPKYCIVVKRPTDDGATLQFRWRVAGRIHLRYRARLPRCRQRIDHRFLPCVLVTAAIQSAFYVEQADVTQADVLTQLAKGCGIPSDAFSQLFASDTGKQTTQQHFQQTIQWGVRGFPSIVAQDAEGYHLLVSGYCSLDMLRQRIDPDNLGAGYAPQREIDT